jgi:hypothetical protein
MDRFRYYEDGPRTERALRPRPGESFFSVRPAEGTAAPAGLSLLPASDTGLHYVGRLERRSSPGPVFSWQGSQLLARFEGRRIGFRFDRIVGRNFFNAIIDGENRLLGLDEGGSSDYVALFDLGAGEHELVLFKRSEGYFGSAALLGLLVEEGARLGRRPEPMGPSIELYGDSITAGACNDDGDADQYDDISTHDAYLSYGAIACRELGAEFTCIAVSGTGITCSWNPILMSEVWDRAAPDPAAARWDFPGRQPDAVVVNLGQNDFGFPHSTGGALSPDFARRYAGFIRAIRGAYPLSRIVCAIGGMSVWRASSNLRRAWKTALAELRAEDGNIEELRFEARSEAHPRVDVHRALARELVSFIRRRKPWPISSAGS